MDTQTGLNKKPKQHRTLWISDVHLGTRNCQARALLDFMAHNEAETVYLVGDIIDGWQLKTLVLATNPQRCDSKTPAQSAQRHADCLYHRQSRYVYP